MLLSGNIKAKQLAVTFDDLPYNRDVTVAELSSSTNKILATLAKYKVKTIGFVNEEKLYFDITNQRTAVLERWLMSGHTLGNHTYSHADFHKLSLSEFESEVIKGEPVIRRLMDKYNKKLKYFRYPYSHAGLDGVTRKEFVNFLNAREYEIAPLTIDTDDYLLDDYYVKALESKKYSKAQELEDIYLKHTAAKFEFYDEVSQKLFGRDIAHIWILHANAINTQLIDKLLDIAQKYGYEFVTIDKALEDDAYKSLDRYFGLYGPSWLYRWDYSNELKIDWRNDPDPKLQMRKYLR